MKRTKLVALVSAAALAAAAAAQGTPASAGDDTLRIAATLGHLAAHARAVGGNRVTVVQLGRGDQDPHFVQPTPSLMVEANRADLYVEVGLDLELWSEHVLDGARNAKIRVGAPGHVFAAVGIPVIERLAVVSRAQGDVHPNGNPHVWLDPLNAILEAQNVAEALKRVDPASAEAYDRGFKEYKARIEESLFGAELVRLLGAETLTGLARKEALADFLEQKKYKGEPLAKRLGGWLGKMRPHRGKKVITYHRDLSYFARAFGLEVVNTIEPKPGIPPTPGHLAELEKLAASTRLGAVFCTPYQNVGVAEGFAKRTSLPVLVLPVDCGATPETQDYFGLVNQLVEQVSAALAKGGTS